MIRLFIPALILLTLYDITPAYSDWQFTKWNMTPEEVEQAASDKYKFYSYANKSGIINELETEYKVGLFAFDVQFIFSKSVNKLEKIILFMRSKGPPRDLYKCRELFSALKSKYGYPMDKYIIKATTKYSWLDKKNGNSVKYFINNHPINGGCSIDYFPLLAGEWDKL